MTQPQVTPNEDRRLLTPKQVAMKLGDVSTAWVRDHLEYPGKKARRLPALRGIKLGMRKGKGLLRIDPRDLDDFIERLRGHGIPLQ